VPRKHRLQFALCVKHSINLCAVLVPRIFETTRDMEKRKRCGLRQKAPQDGKKRRKRNTDPAEQVKLRSDTDQPTAKRIDQDAQSSSDSLGANFTHPFPVDPFDQCETPFQAYCDIEPLLSLLASRLKIEKQDLLIFDPYFCHGSVIRHLGSLGFTSVYNRNEDFYSSIGNHTIPPYHILVIPIPRQKSR